MQRFAMMMCNVDYPMRLSDQFKLSTGRTLTLNMPLSEDPLGSPKPTDTPQVQDGEWTEKQKQEMKEIGCMY